MNLTPIITAPPVVTTPIVAPVKPLTTWAEIVEVEPRIGAIIVAAGVRIPAPKRVF